MDVQHVASPLKLNFNYDKSHSGTKHHFKSFIMESSLKPQYDQQGYVIVQGLLPNRHRFAIQDACDRVIARTRSGDWTHRRTVGKQFPPYGDDHPDSWGVQHIMHPELGEPAFARWYTSKALIDVVKQLLECKRDDLQMGEPLLCYLLLSCVQTKLLLLVELMKNFSISSSIRFRMISLCVGTEMT